MCCTRLWIVRSYISELSHCTVPSRPTTTRRPWTELLTRPILRSARATRRRYSALCFSWLTHAGVTNSSTSCLTSCHSRDAKAVAVFFILRPAHTRRCSCRHPSTMYTKTFVFLGGRTAVTIGKENNCEQGTGRSRTIRGWVVVETFPWGIARCCCGLCCEEAWLMTYLARWRIDGLCLISSTRTCTVHTIQVVFFMQHRHEQSNSHS